MPQALGVSFHRTGWTGACTITNTGTSATSAVDSTGSTARSAVDFLNAIETAGKSLISSDFAWSVNASSVVTISSTVAFSLSFTGTTAARLGFSSSSQTGASSYTANTTAPGVFAPYSTAGLLYAGDVRSASIPGVATGSGSIWMRTPASDSKSPLIVLEVLRAQVLEFIAAHSYVGTPSRVDVFNSDHGVDTYHVSGVNMMEQSELSGWSTIELGVVS